MNASSAKRSFAWCAIVLIAIALGYASPAAGIGFILLLMLSVLSDIRDVLNRH